MIDKQVVDLCCPSCKKSMSRSVGWLKSNIQFTCNCGAALSISDTELLEKIYEIENSLKMLRKQFGDRIKFLDI